MANSSLPTGSTLALQSWAPLTGALTQTLGEFPLGALVKLGCIQESAEEILKAKQNGYTASGVTANFPYIPKISPTGIGYLDSGTSQARNLTIESYTVNANMIRYPVSVPGGDNFTALQAAQIFQSQEFSKKIALDAAMKALVENQTISVMNQLVGWSPTQTNSSIVNNELTINANDTFAYSQFQGFNTVDAVDSTRLIRPASITDDASLTTSHRLTATFLETALANLDRSAYPIEPISFNGQNIYVLFVHPETAFDLQTTVSASALTFTNWELAQIQGNYDMKKEGALNPKTAMGVNVLGLWRNRILIVSTRYVPYGVSNAGAVVTTSRRNVLVGKNAVSFFSPYGALSDATARLMGDAIRNPKAAADAYAPTVRVGVQEIDGNMNTVYDLRCISGFKRIKPSNRPDTNVLVLPTYASL